MLKKGLKWKTFFKCRFIFIFMLSKYRFPKIVCVSVNSIFENAMFVIVHLSNNIKNWSFFFFNLKFQNPNNEYRYVFYEIVSQFLQIQISKYKPITMRWQTFEEDEFWKHSSLCKIYTILKIEALSIKWKCNML